MCVPRRALTGVLGLAATLATLVPAGTAYMRINTVMLPFSAIAMVANVSLRGAGDSVPGMFSTMLTRGAASLVLATHPDNADGAPDLVRRFVRYGASPRGAQALVLLVPVGVILGLAGAWLAVSRHLAAIRPE